MSDKRIYGIDLGTTYSCIAVVNDYGKPEVLNNAEGDSTTPSVVYFESSDNIPVGKTAKNSSKMYPDRTISMIKREMGNPEFTLDIDGKSYKPEEISSFILRKLVQDASDLRGGEPITDVVITCPAYFGINHREATKAAGELAGLVVHRVINEPTAAAFFYGVEKGNDQVVLVYDLGGGTFDVTLIDVKDGNVQVVYTDGNHNLGGKDWDDLLVNYLAEQFMSEHADKGDPRDDDETLQRLVLDAEEIKRSLTTKEKVQTSIDYNFARAKVEITRDDYEALTSSLLESTITLTRTVIEEGAKKGYSSINRLLLVGGSSLMPQVSKRLKADFTIPTELFEPNLAVAKGAALVGAKIVAGELLQESLKEMTGSSDVTQADESTLRKAAEQAAQKSQFLIGGAKFKDLATTEFSDVCSKSFGVVTEDASEKQTVVFLIHNNTRVPQNVTQQFGTLTANQRIVDIQIMEQAGQTESPDVADNKLVTQGEIADLPPGLPAGSPIDISFQLEADGRLTVSAIEPSSGKSLRLEARLEGVMTKEEIKAKKGLLLQKQVS